MFLLTQGPNLKAILTSSFALMLPPHGNLPFSSPIHIPTIVQQTLVTSQLVYYSAEKIQEEIDSMVGQERPPCLEDRERLPYTNAVIHEIQRFISVLPMSLPHILTQDTHFRGHFLPKGTNIIPLLISAHQDPTQFKDPENFNPNNFLDDKGAFQNNEAFMPFALGWNRDWNG
ncbi:cytochrome P450 2F2-like [Gracilinanus agilis]|uniref:cytochrome P450 2F2-like n=1 Tax=Gracilinanus agilis TaxID=191870 RepID=UPI001CFF0EDF|nr:cytochrome P450 2F2-like [Gracilinanus agilis]